MSKPYRIRSIILPLTAFVVGTYFLTTGIARKANSPSTYYLVTHLEDRPGAVYKTTLSLSKTGFSAVATENIDLRSIGGSIMNCASTHSSWSTHISAEEDYNLDGYYFGAGSRPYSKRHIRACRLDKDDRFTGEDMGTSSEKLCRDAYQLATNYLHEAYDDSSEKIDVTKNFSPYNYGYQYEIAVDAIGRTTVSGKHYIMGKYTPEQALVMPDQKTVYMTDDDDARGFYMFIADKARDLSAGTLYMAKYTQTSAVGTDVDANGDGSGGNGSIEWVNLGQSDDATIKTLIEKNPTIDDIFDIADPDDCNAHHALIKAGNPGRMCLLLRDGENGTTLSKRFSGADEVRLAAAFLETRKYGAMLGASSEMRKEEGLTYSTEHNAIYLAVSDVDKDMRDNSEGDEVANHMKLSHNDCGAIMKLPYAGSRSDTAGAPIHSRYVATSMSGIVWGRPIKADPDGNSCDTGGIGNPDNIRYLGGDILLIGEDGTHANNMVWAFDLSQTFSPGREGGQIGHGLTRLLTIPRKGEVTGAFEYHHDTANKNYYIFVNAQHADTDRDGKSDAGVIGYIKIAGVSDNDPFIDASFSNLELPVTDEEKYSTRVSGRMKKRDKLYVVSYTELFKTGDKIGDHVFGVLYDTDGNKLKEADHSDRISMNPDGISLFTIK